MHHLIIDCPDPAALAALDAPLLGLPVTYASDDFVVVSRDASPHKVVAASLAEVLESFADGLERGDYEIEPFVGIVPRTSRADE